MTEKDSIKIILERRGVISNGVFDELRFRKLVTEPWIYAKTVKYGFDKMNENNTQVVDNEPVVEEVVDTVYDSFKPIALTNVMIDTPVVETETVTETAETETEGQVVEQEEVTVVEEIVPVVEEPVVENVEETTEEVVETSKKKTTKKK